MKRYWTWVLVVPGFVTMITPPHWHMQVLPTARIGLLFTCFCGAIGGFQGLVVMGMQAIGVGTAGGGLPMPEGFEGAMHIAIGMMFTIGMKSWMVAAGFPSIMTVFPGIGIVIRAPGPVLNEHWICAEAATTGGMPRRYTI